MVVERSISGLAAKNHLVKYLFQDEIRSCSSMTILSISVSNSQGPEFEYLLLMLNVEYP